MVRLKTFQLHTDHYDMDVCYIFLKEENKIIVLQYLFEVSDSLVNGGRSFEEEFGDLFVEQKVVIVKDANVFEKSFSIDYSELSAKNKTYIIVTTWNGPGYSDENRVFGRLSCSNKLVKTVCKGLMNINEELGNSFTHELKNGWGWTTKRHDDSGSYQAVIVTEDLYGLIVSVNINSVDPCTKEDFEEQKSIIVQHADAEDLDDIEDLDADRVFIPATTLEYDYQFIKL